MPEHGEHVAALFEAAVSLDPEQRSAFLDRACGDDGSLRQEVEELLHADAAAGSFLKHPVFDLPTADDSHGSQAPIGPYHLLELIGQGGMGEVWLAEQKHPVRRRVAIKLIKVGMDTKEVVARFESERQALALMDHPAIAKVFDAGSTPEGRPYFVMEYVPGLPITDYCDKHKLTIRQRLELFTRVCDGVQHAHQKAIIHRDLKPSNILVNEVDGKPVPRIIDFGVSKAISQTLTARTVYTRIGTLVGTVGYMSPEQANSDGEDIDTRTDVYSLGAVLYEVLSGALPFDFRKAAYDEVVRQLREEDAPKPSTKLRTFGEFSSVAATNRGTDLSTLCRQLSGDPDSIALKALEKDRARRYASASELAGDIARYLRNEPVTAHPPSTAYRARKYLRRHRAAVAVAAALVLLLVAFAIVQTVALRHVARERDRATRERDRATRERDRADRISQFMTGMFQAPNPWETREGSNVTVREVLDRASNQIDHDLANDPELQAQLMSTMADTYLGLGLEQRAENLYRRVLDIRERILGPKNADTFHTKESLAQLLANRGHYAEADKLVREALQTQTSVGGAENRDTLRIAVWLARNFCAEGHYAEAEKLARQTLEVQQRVLGLDDPDTGGTKFFLAATLRGAGRYPEAMRIDRELVDSRMRASGPDARGVLVHQLWLGADLSHAGRLPEAEELLRSLLPKDRQVFGSDNYQTGLAEAQLANALRQERKYVEAETLARESVALMSRIESPDNDSMRYSSEVLGLVLTAEGHYRDAQNINRQLLHAVEGQPVKVQGGVWYYLADAAAVAGRRSESLEDLDKALTDGGVSVGAIAADSDLKRLRGDPRFDALVAKAQQTATR
jgi:non-specific serine/threonine protein kinase/serine/threonine-protein kinase